MPHTTVTQPKFEILPKRLHSRNVPDFVPSASLPPIVETSPPSSPPPLTDIPLPSSPPIPVSSTHEDKPQTVLADNGEDVFGVSPRIIEKLESDLNEIKQGLKRDSTSEQWVFFKDIKKCPLEGQVTNDK